MRALIPLPAGDLGLLWFSWQPWNLGVLTWGLESSVSYISSSELSKVYVVVQLLIRVRLFVTLWAAARQACLSLTISWSLPKLMSIESVMPSPISSSVIPFSSCLQSFPAPQFEGINSLVLSFFLLSGSHIPYMTTGKTLAFKGPCSQTKPLPTKVYRMLSMEALFSVASAFSFPFVIC